MDTCLPAGRERKLLKMIYVYAIVSKKDKRIYVGMSENVEQRLREHNAGKTKSTKGFIPWELIFTESCIDRKLARVREKYYKSGVGKEFLKTLVP